MRAVRGWWPWAMLALALWWLGAGAATPGMAAGDRPALAVQTLDGTTFDLAAERGKWVIVNFWATWCAPCIAEMPAISKFVADHRDVTAVGLAWQDDPPGKIRKFVAAHPVEYPLAIVDPADPPAGFPAPQALPTTWLVAPDGTVARHFLGPVDAQVLGAAIAAHAAPGS